MTITNSALAQKLDLVATGWQNFVVQQINWLTSTEATVTLTDPYDATISVVVKTPVELARAVEALIDPANGALTEAEAHLAAVEQLVANTQSSLATVDQKLATANQLVTDAQGYANTASSAAGSASTSATQAATSAQNAANSAASASTSATNAATSATAAADSANVAKTQRARTWYVGDGAAGTISGQLAGDLYLDRLSGDVFELIGTTWTFKQNLKGPKGDKGDIGPQGPAGADGTSISAADILTRLKTVDGATSGLDADLLDGQDSAYYLAWANLTGKPTTFTPTAHTHAWGDITSPPVYTTRWPAWTEVTGKPTTFAPSAHTHAWADINSGVPETATRWPAWTEVTGKPGTFTPSAHTHAIADVTGLQTALDGKAPANGTVAFDNVSGTMTHDNGYLTIKPYNGTYDDGSKIESYYDGNTRTWKLYTRDASNAIGDVTITLNGKTVINTSDVSESNVASSIAKRSPNGDIVGRLFRSEFGDQNTMSGAIAYRINSTTDNYTRYCNNNVAVRTWLGLGSAALNASTDFASAAHDNLRTALNSVAATITDWNSANTNGWYMGSNAANAPGTGWYIGIVTRHNAIWMTQEVWDFTAAATTIRYRRHMLNGSWTAWTSDVNVGILSASRVVSGGYDSAIAGSMNCDNWFRSSGSTGWYSATYGGGIYMTDSTWVRVYNNKSFMSSNTIQGNRVECTLGGFYQLTADSAAWARQARTFVQSGDPGAQSSDGDLWIW